MNIVNFGQSSLENAQPSTEGWRVLQGNFILGYSENFTFEIAKLFYHYIP